MDDAGFVYVTGYTNGAAFPTTPGPLSAFPGAGNAVFVQKINPRNNQRVYSVLLGGSGPDRATSIAVDKAGNVFVTGYTHSPDFPGAEGVNRKPGPLDGDAFLFRLDASRALLYSRLSGGSGQDAGTAIALSNDGSMAIVGSTASSDFPTSPNAIQPRLGPQGSNLPRTDVSFSGWTTMGGCSMEPTWAVLAVVRPQESR